MSLIPLISLDELEQHCLRRDFEILKIKIDLNSSLLLQQYENVKTQYPLRCKDEDPLYKGISLHYSDAQEPLYDGLNQVVYMKPNGQTEYYQVGMRLFHRENDVAKKFGWVFSKLPFRMFRGRLLESHPKHRLAEHSDGPVRLTLHIPITSNSDNLFYLNKTAYHLESDGCAYVINTSHQHWIENKGNQVRAHLIFNVGRMSFWPLSPDYLDELDYHYAKIGHKGFENLLQRFRDKMMSQDYCALCEKKTDLFPVINDFLSLKDSAKPEDFQLLCQPCTKSMMEKRRIWKSYDL